MLPNEQSPLLRQGSGLLTSMTSKTSAVDDIGSRSHFPRMTPRLLAMYLNAFLTYVTLSTLAPLLPHHMRTLGLPAYVAPLVFVAHPVAMVIAAMPVNVMLLYNSRERVFRGGVMLASVATALFAATPAIADVAPAESQWWVQLVLLLVSRFMQGCGAKASFVSILSEVTDERHGDETELCTAIAWNELVTGAGFTVGPLLGGALYDVAGFPAPFAIGSVALALLAVFVPHQSASAESDENTSQAPSTDLDPHGEVLARMLAVFRRPAAAAAVTMASLQLTFFGIVDSGSWTVHAGGPELRLSPTSIGLCLSLLAAAYNVLGVFVPQLRPAPLTLMLLGSAVSGFGDFVLGPLAGPISVRLAEVSEGYISVRSARVFTECVGLSVCAAGASLTLIPALPVLTEGSDADPRATEATIAVFDIAFNVGTIVGPLVGSIMSTGEPDQNTFSDGIGVLGVVVLLNVAVQFYRTKSAYILRE